MTTAGKTEAENARPPGEPKPDDRLELLTQRSAMLDSILESMPSGVVAVDMSGRILVNNPAAVAISGLRTEDFPDDPAQWAEAYGARALDGRLLDLTEIPIARALAGETVTDVDLLMQNSRNGNGVHVAASARPLLDAQGVRVGAVVVFTDFSARKRAESALREKTRQLEYFRLIAEGAEDFIALSGLDRRVTYINPAGRRALGLPTMEAVQKTELLDYIFDHDLPKARGEWLPALARDGHISVEIDARHFVTGEVVPMHWRAFVLNDPESGQPYAIAAFGQLLAERRRAEAESKRQRQALVESEARFRGLAANTPGVFYRARDQPGWPLLDISDGIEAITGHPAEAFIKEGLLFADIVLQEDIAALDESIRTQTRLDGNLHVDYRLRHLDGSIRAIESMARRVQLPDGSGCIEGFLIDASQRIQTEAALAESETRIRLMTDAAPQILWTAGPSGDIDFVNRSGLASFGRSLADLSGRGWLTSLHPDDLANTISIWSRSLASGDAVALQYRIRGPDGAYRWHLARGVAQMGEDGRPQRWFGVTSDIEDVRQAQLTAETATQALAVSERRFRALVNNFPGFVYTSDAATPWRVHYASAQTESLTGYSPEAFTEGDLTYQAIMLPEDVEPTLQTLSAQLAAGEPLRSEHRIRRKDGTTRWVEARANPVDGPEGLRFDGIVLDITERKLADDALRASEARFRFIAEALPLGIMIATPDSRFHYSNPWMERLTGYSTDDMQQGRWAAIVHPDDVTEHARRWAVMIAGGVPFSFEYRFKCGSGDFRWLHAQAVVTKDEHGQPQSIVVGVLDIDDLVRARYAAEEATRLKSVFLSSMSHEIRTPMNAVIGMTSILLDSDLNPEQRDSAEVIRSSGEHLLTVINDILDYSKIEAGAMQIERAPMSLRDCIESALDLVSGAAHDKGVELGYLAAAGLPDTLLGDIGRLRQVLVNLLSNAIKFTPADGQVALEVSAAIVDEGQHQFTFDVHDTGIGIAPEVLPRLFQSFTQADSSTTREYGGTGLGLSISKKLVELMGGQIGATSTQGRGSCFSFSIQAPLAAMQQRVNGLTQPQLQGRRVLIVDDIEINRRILLHYTTIWGMLPFATESPREALQWVRRGDVFDVALLDFHMPGMDGLQLARQLRARRSEDELPIVMLSSAADDARAAGVITSSILKPLKPSRLLDELQNLFARTPQAAAPLAPTVALPRSLGRDHPLRILIVEDNAINQKVARLLFERMAYAPDFAGDGLEALEALERQTYDVVFMDVQMPVMDGLAATREICRRRPAGERPRIVAMTANATLEDRKTCELAGMDDYLAKPVVPERVIEALKKCRRREQGVAVVDDLDFNLDGIQQLRDMLEDAGAIEVVQALIDDLPWQAREISQALAQADAKTLQRHAHSIKGICRMLGSPSLGEAFAEVENALGDGAVDLAPSQIVSLLRRYETLVITARLALPP